MLHHFQRACEKSSLLLVDRCKAKLFLVCAALLAAELPPTHRPANASPAGCPEHGYACVQVAVLRCCWQHSCNQQTRCMCLQGKGGRGGAGAKEEGGQSGAASSSAELAKQLAALQVAAATPSGSRTVQVSTPRFCRSQVLPAPS